MTKQPPRGPRADRAGLDPMDPDPDQLDPEERNPNQRRVWIVIAVLAVLALAGGVRWYMASNDGDDTPPVATTTIEEETPPPTEPVETAPDAPDEEPIADEEAADLGPLVISVETPGNGGGVIVTQLGPIDLSEGLPTIDALVPTLGPPTSSGGDAQVKDYCVAAWDQLGITGYFYFGHPPSLRASCSKGVLVSAVLGGGWSTDRGLAVGDDASQIAELYPDAEAEVVSDGYARIIGSRELHQLELNDYGGEPFATLAAAVVAGDVSALVYQSGAD